jgi:hypothetical protein
VRWSRKSASSVPASAVRSCRCRAEICTFSRL